MKEPEIKQLLDTLSEYEDQRTLLQMDKRKLLDDVKVPEEITNIQRAEYDQQDELDRKLAIDMREISESVNDKLAEVEIPEEVKALLVEIDARRRMILLEGEARQNHAKEIFTTEKQAIREATEAQTRDVYAAIAVRKNEIEIEFQGKEAAVDDNIKKLTEQIKAATKEIGYTITGAHYQAVWSKGKKSWIPQRLDKYTETHPDIKECYTVGEASVALKKI